MIVSISNFQSIEDITLDLPEDSFTCIVGRSNIGKSAIRRAIECVLFNKSEISYIRNGTKICSVEVTFKNGKNVKWFRDEKSSWYIIDGETFSKLNKSVPQPILDLGFKEVMINKEKINIQVASQFNNIFLLNETGTRVTDVLSNLGNLNRIITANKNCTSDIKTKKGYLTVRKQDLDLVKDKIIGFSGLDEQRNKLDTLKQEYEKIGKDTEKVNKAKTLRDKLLLSRDKRGHFSTLGGIVIPEISLDIELLKNVNTLNSKIEKSEKVLNAFKGIENIDIQAPNLDIQRYKELKDKQDRIEKITKSLNCYKVNFDPPELTLDLETYRKLKDLLSKLLISKNNLLTTNKLLEDNEKKITIFTQEETEIHKEVKICPLCNKDFGCSE